MLPQLQPDIQNALARFKKIKKEDLSNVEKILKKQLDQVTNSIYEIAKQMAQMENGRTRLEGSYIGLAKTVEEIMKEKENDTDNIADTSDNPGSDGPE